MLALGEENIKFYIKFLFLKSLKINLKMSFGFYVKLRITRILH